MFKTPIDKIEFYAQHLDKKNIIENIMSYELEAYKTKELLETLKKRCHFWQNVLNVKVNKENKKVKK